MYFLHMLLQVFSFQLVSLQTSRKRKAQLAQMNACCADVSCWMVSLSAVSLAIFVVVRRCNPR